MEKYAKAGIPSVVYQDHLLQAELAAYQGKTDDAEKRFQSAAVSATRGGFLHGSAMVQERYGEFLLHVAGEEKEASFRFREAIKLYDEWGCSRKSRLLRERYRDLLS